MKKQLEDLYEFVVDNIDPDIVFQAEVPEANWNVGSNSNVWCPFHNPEGKFAAQSPSLSVNSDTGQFFCHSCGAKGNNIVQFYQQLHQLSFRSTLLTLFTDHIHPLVSEQFIHHWHDNLMHTPEVLDWLVDNRGISEEVIEHSGILIGFDGDRITLPVRNEFGLYVNVRRYDFRNVHERKMLNYAKGYGGTELYPSCNVGAESLLLVEGEMDALLLTSLGYKAVTPTGGVGSWSRPPERFNQFFKNKDVVIIFDVNDPQDAGIKCAVKRANLLSNIAKSIKVVELPLENRGGDVTDFFIKEGLSLDEFNHLIESTPFWKATSDVETHESGAIYDIELANASQAKYVNKQVKCRALVAGKDDTPFSTPSVVKFRCPTDPDKRCNSCPHGESASNEEEIELFVEEVTILDAIIKPTSQLDPYVKIICGYPKDCGRADMEYTEYKNVERLALVPDLLQAGSMGANYVQRDGYFIGHGLESNRTYEMISKPVPHPRTQKVVHVITEAKSVSSSYETFQMTPEVFEQLKVFQTKDIEGMLAELYEDYAFNLTQIVGRPWLHMAIDLAFFSPLSFYFGSEYIHKGWMDVFIGGDSRTGKGKIVEALIQFYQGGQIIDSGNTSKAGLVGGVSQQDGRNFITWGPYVQNDGKLLTIDEVSSLDPQIIKDLSRPRSEGIADIVKISTDRARCRTRLIMISNPRNNWSVSKFNYGVEVVRNVIEQMEDIARFDYAYITADADVSSEFINSERSPRPESKYITSASKFLVQWVWSRKKEQILFRDKARKLCLQEAVRLGKKYSTEIPLVQASNIRIKIAKVAAAIAGRTFSCNPRGDKIIVTRDHVEASVRFLEEKCYDTPTMGYDAFSHGQKVESEVSDPGRAEKVIDNLLDRAPRAVEALLRRKVFSFSDLRDFTGTDRETAEQMKSELIMTGCFVKGYRDALIKTGGFQKILQKLKARYDKKGPRKFRRT